MAVQKDPGSGAPATNSRQATRTGTSSRTSTVSSSGRSASPGPSRPTAGRGSGGGSGRASSGTAPPRSPGSHPSRGAAAAPGAAPYRYLVLPGNESVLLREALERRPWWEPVPPPPPPSGSPKEKATGAAAAAQQQQCWNLWAGLNGQRFSQYELLQPGGAGACDTDPASRRLVNRLQEHRLICTKSGLADVLAAIKAATAAATATAAGAATGSAATTAAATSATPDPPGAEAAVAEPRSGAGNTGSRSGSRSGSGLDLSWIPETYVVPAGPKVAAAGGGGALSAFKAAFARHAAAGRRVWIAKPTCLNRGNGIEVYDSMEQILEHLKGRPAGSSLILQKYIERPMLLGGRKFDIRAYVLVGPHDDSVWFYKEAYCRTSSTPYDSSDLANRSAHLTNDAVQKHLDTYHAFEDHCKMSLQELGPALKRAEAVAVEAAGGHAGGGAAASSPSLSPSPSPSLDTRPGVESGLWGAMRRCVAALFSVARPAALNPRRLGHCFELLGLDFMMDAEGGLYLIEVNTSPALFRAGAYLSDLLPRLVEEVVQKVVDPLFPPPPPPPPPQPPSSGSTASVPTGAPATAAAAAAATAAGVDVNVCGEGAAAQSVAAAPLPLLDGFVRVELDEQLAAAAAAAGKAGKSSRVLSLGRSAGQRAAAAVAAAAVGGKAAVVPPGGSRPATVAAVAVGGGVLRAAPRRPPAATR